MKRFLLGYFSAILTMLAPPLGFAGYLWLTTPSTKNIRDCIVTEFNKVRLCPTDRSYVTLDAIAPAVRSAVLVSEDSTFYTHNGFDFIELAESYRKNQRLGKFARGGSTITQQLAKNVYLNSEKSILRKIREALIAHNLESTLSKDEILEKYLNVVEFGEGIYGIAAASQHYFKKAPAKLSLSEGAFLAFLLPSPVKYSISFQKRKLTPFAQGEMQKIVMRAADAGKLPQELRSQALDEIHNFFGSTTVATRQQLPSEEEQSQASDMEGTGEDLPGELLETFELKRHPTDDSPSPLETRLEGEKANENEG